LSSPAALQSDTASHTVDQDDQHGVTRQLQPTIGAYEKRALEYFYIGAPDGNVNDFANWQDSTGRTPVSFTIADGLFVYDTAVTISSNWTLGSKAGSEVRTGGDVTVANGVLVTATMSLTGAGFLAVDGKFSGSMFVTGNSTLELATADANLTGLVLSVNSNSSTVAYSYSGSQTVITAAYGNLILSGDLPGTSRMLSALQSTATSVCTTFSSQHLQIIAYRAWRCYRRRQHQQRQRHTGSASSNIAFSAIFWRREQPEASMFGSVWTLPEILPLSMAQSVFILRRCGA
jgi:hypothetical protein